MTIFYGTFQKFLDDDKFTELSLHLSKKILKTYHLTTKIAKFIIILYAFQWTDEKRI